MNANISDVYYNKADGNKPEWQNVLLAILWTGAVEQIKQGVSKQQETARCHKELQRVTKNRRQHWIRI